MKTMLTNPQPVLGIDWFIRLQNSIGICTLSQRVSLVSIALILINGIFQSRTIAVRYQL